MFSPRRTPGRIVQLIRLTAIGLSNFLLTAFIFRLWESILLGFLSSVSHILINQHVCG